MTLKEADLIDSSYKCGGSISPIYKLKNGDIVREVGDSYKILDFSNPNANIVTEYLSAI